MLNTKEFQAVIPTRTSRGKLNIEKYANAKPGVFSAANAVCVLGELVNGVKGNVITSHWYVEKVADHDPGSLIGSSEINIEEDGSYDISFSFQPPFGGWPPGEYRVEIYFNGALQASHVFSMR